VSGRRAISSSGCDFFQEIKEFLFAFRANSPIDRHALISLMKICLSFEPIIEKAPRSVQLYSSDEVVHGFLKPVMIILVENNRDSPLSQDLSCFVDHLGDDGGIVSAVSVEKDEIGDFCNTR